MLIDITGTMFTSISTNSSQMVKTSIISNYSLSSTPDIHLAEAVDRLLELYPDIPALGSPFSTGDDTFGLDSEFKRLAAISAFLLPPDSIEALASRLDVYANHPHSRRPVVPIPAPRVVPDCEQSGRQNVRIPVHRSGPSGVSAVFGG